MPRYLQAAQLLVAVALAACASRQPAARASDAPDLRVGIFCAEVAWERGLRFTSSYGPVVARSQLGAIMQRNFGQGAAVADYDQDGDLDVYLLAQAGQPNRLFQNRLESGLPGFVDVTRRAGVGDTGLSRVAHFADLDGDLLPDLLLANDYDAHGLPSPSRLYRNAGDGTFQDVTAGSGFDPFGYLVGGAALADLDADGDLDIYLAYWTRELGATPHGAIPRGMFPGRNLTFENLDSFRFREVGIDWGLEHLRIDTMTPVFHDFDADGDPDLYLAVDHRSDRYYRNEAGPAFNDASRQTGVFHRGNDMGVAVADVDGNGAYDLFVTNILDPQEAFGVEPVGNTLLMGRPASEAEPFMFRDVAREAGVLDTGWGWGAVFSDIDADGDEDLLAVQGFDEYVGPGRDLYDARSVLFRRDSEGTGPVPVFSRVEGTGCDVPGDQRALVAFDYDRDGDPDYLVTQVDGPTLLLENQGTGGGTLTVDLAPAGVLAVGAEVVVQSPARVQRRLIMAGGSYLAGPPPEAYFGTGAAAEVSVEVRWPDGSMDRFSRVPVGSILMVAPGEARGLKTRQGRADWHPAAAE